MTLKLENSVLNLSIKSLLQTQCKINYETFLNENHIKCASLVVLLTILFSYYQLLIHDFIRNINGLRFYLEN